MQTIGKIINGKYVRYGAVSVGDKLGDAAFANIVNNATTTEEGFVPDARVVAQQQQIITQQQEQIDSLNSACSAILKFIDYMVGTVTISELNYKQITLPEERNYLFASIVTWGSCNAVFTVVGSGKWFFVVANSGTVVSGLKIRLWYI